MKTDCELLELAARAAGKSLAFWSCGGEPYSGGEGFIQESGRVWNPLFSSADAFELAVKLQLFHVAHLCEFTHRSQGYGDGPCAVTRRAIVQAAASIQQAKEAP